MSSIFSLIPFLLLPFAALFDPAHAVDGASLRTGGSRTGHEASPSAAVQELSKHGLVAVEIGRWSVLEANQGVAVDAEHFYGIGNFALVKHRKDTGARVAERIGQKGGPIIHYNGGHVVDGRLVLAHSNFPGVPMTSSLEIHDPTDLSLVRSHSFGIRLGSLTWAERHEGVWWACFANYNANGGIPGFDQTWTYFGKFDDNWQLLESWTFPPQVIATWHNSSSSGGSWGGDGLLYVTGHDEPELNVLRLPTGGGSMLEYVTTIDVPFEGQSWAWDRSVAPRRVIYGISRRAKDIIAAEIPAVPAELLTNHK